MSKPWHEEAREWLTEVQATLKYRSEHPGMSTLMEVRGLAPEVVRAALAERDAALERVRLLQDAEAGRCAACTEVGRDNERAAVVAHLRSMAKPYEESTDDYERGIWWAWMSEVEVIERAEHVQEVGADAFPPAGEER